jgi:hypothetical protein
MICNCEPQKICDDFITIVVAAFVPNSFCFFPVHVIICALAGNSGYLASDLSARDASCRRTVEGASGTGRRGCEYPKFDFCRGE